MPRPTLWLAAIDGGWRLVSVTDSKRYSEALGAIGTEQVQLCSREDLQPIFVKKMPCRDKDASQEQLSDRSKISKDEKIAFMRWRVLSEESNQKAAKIHREYNRQTGDAVASLTKNNEEASTKLAAQLYDGRISYSIIRVVLRSDYKWNKKQKIRLIEAFNIERHCLHDLPRRAQSV
jgi:hypothetical protein